MPTDTVHCPYCNATLRLSPEDQGRPKVDCPRCGDSFPNARRLPPDGITATPGVARDNGRPLPEPAPVRLSNAAIARGVLALMLFMAVLGGTYAVVTQQFRRANDVRGLPKAPDASSAPWRATAPADLAALKHLPADCFAVAGFHFADLLQQKEGADLLRQMTAGNGSDLGLAFVHRWTGLKPEEIDHVAAGVRSSGELPAVAVVVRTKRPYAPELVGEALKPAKPDDFRGRPLYRARGGQTQVLCLGPQTVVIQTGFLAPQGKDWEAVPPEPAGEAKLSPPLAELLRQRVPAESFLWAVADAGPTQALQELWKLAAPGNQQLGLLRRVKQAAAGVRFQKGLTLAAAVEGVDARAAAELTKLLDQPAAEGTEYRVVGPDPAAAADVWVNVQLRMPTDRFAAWLRERAEGWPKGAKE